MALYAVVAPAYRRRQGIKMAPQYIGNHFVITRVTIIGKKLRICGYTIKKVAIFAALKPLSCSVMVAPQILVLLVRVRVLPRQPQSLVSE